MSTLYDVLDPKVRSRYPLQSLEPEAQRLLSQPIPDKWARGANAVAINEFLSRKIGRMIPMPAWQRRGESMPPPPAELLRQPQYLSPEDYAAKKESEQYEREAGITKFTESLPLWQRAPLVGGQAWVGALPLPDALKWKATYAQPEGLVEKAANLMGGAGGFAVTSAGAGGLVGKAGQLVGGPVGRTLISQAGRVGLAAGGAAPSGTARERLQGAATTVAAGEVGHALGLVATNLVVRRSPLAREAIRRLERMFQTPGNITGKQTGRIGSAYRAAKYAQTVAPGRAGMVTDMAASAGAFGVAQPWMEYYASPYIAGHEGQKPTLPDMIEGFAGMMLLNMATGGGRIREGSPSMRTLMEDNFAAERRTGRMLPDQAIQQEMTPLAAPAGAPPTPTEPPAPAARERRGPPPLVTPPTLSPVHQKVSDRYSAQLPAVEAEAFRRIFARTLNPAASSNEAQKHAADLRVLIREAARVWEIPTPTIEDPPNAVERGQRMSAELTRILLDRELTFDDGKGVYARGRVVEANVYPYKRNASQVRLLVEDAVTGRPMPMLFKNMAELSTHMGGMSKIRAAEGAAPVAAPETEAGKPSPVRVPPPSVAPEAPKPEIQAPPPPPPPMPEPGKRTPPERREAAAPTYQRSTGEVVKVADLSDKHLDNALKKAMREGSDQVASLQAEVERRKAGGVTVPEKKGKPAKAGEYEPPEGRELVKGMMFDTEEQGAGIVARLNATNPNADAKIVKIKGGFVMEVNKSAAGPSGRVKKIPAPVKPEERKPAVAPEPAPKAEEGPSAPTGKAQESKAPGESGFMAAFEKVWKDNATDPEAAVAAARELSKEEPPEGFDAAKEISRRRAEALAAAGQGDLFGGKAVRAEQKPKVEEKPELIRGTVGAEQAITETKAGKMERIPGGLDTAEMTLLPEKFQNRVEAVLGAGSHIDQRKIQDMLVKGKGDIDIDKMEAQPIIMWVDTKGEAGEPGKRYILDGHHRHWLATHTWELNKNGEYVATGERRMKLPAVEYKGTFDEAIELAKDANRQATPNTYFEDVVRARELADRGVDSRTIAAQLNKKESAVKELLNVSYLDRDLAVTYLRGVEPGSDLAKSAAYIGAAAKDFPRDMDAENQRQYLHMVGTGKILAVKELKEQMKGYLDGLRMLRQEKLIPEGEAAPSFKPEHWERATGRVLRRLRQAMDPLIGPARLHAKYTKEGMKDLADSQLAALKLTDKYLREMSKKLEGVLDFKPDSKGAWHADVEMLQRRFLKEYAKGTPAEKIAEQIKREIDERLGEEGPLDWTADERGFISADMAQWPIELARAVALHTASNIRKAWRIWRNTLPRRERFNTMTDSHGNVRVKEEVYHDMDVYSESAAYRLAAMLGHGYSTLPGPLSREMIKAEEDHAYFINLFQDKWQELLSDKQRAQIAAFYPGSTEAFRAVESLPYIDKNGVPHLNPKARPVKMTPELREIAMKIKAFQAWALEVVNQHRVANGLKPVDARKFYAPHLMIDQFGQDMDSMVEGLFGRKMEQGDKREIKDRFFMRREMFERYQEDITMATQMWIHAASRHLAYLSFLRETNSWLAANALSNPIRAEYVRKFLENNLFRRRGTFTTMLDGLARRIGFKNAGDIGRVEDHRLIETELGLAKGSLRRMKGEFYAAPDGTAVRPTDSAAAVVALGSHNGTAFYFVNEGHLMARYPKMRKIWGRIRRAKGVAHLRLKKTLGVLDKSYNWDEHLKAMLKEQKAKATDFYNSPSEMISNSLGGRMVRALLAWNMRATNQNAGQMLLTTAPEYGFMSAARGLSRGVVAGFERFRANAIDFYERSGLMSPANAQLARQGMYLKPRVLAAEGIGARQSDVIRSEAGLRREMEGTSKGGLYIFRKLREMAGGMWPYGLVEDATRGIDALAAFSVAHRMGLTPPQVQKFYNATRGGMLQLRRDISKDITNPKSQASYAAQMYPITMFDYGALGGIGLHAGAVGSLLMRLTKFPINYLLNYEVRPVQGFLSVGTAALRGVLRAATGGKYGNKTPGMSLLGTRTRLGSKVPSISRYPTPDQFHAGERFAKQRAGLDKWLEKGGAGYFQRHAATVFVRQAAMFGFLLLLSEKFKTNFAVYGMPGWGLALTALIMELDKNHAHDAMWKRTMQRARFATVINYGRAVVPVGPLMTMLWGLGEAFGSGFMSLDQGLGAAGKRAVKTMEARGGGIAETMRQLLIKVLQAQRTFYRANPEVIDAFNGVLEPLDEQLKRVGLSGKIEDIYGIKSVVEDLTPFERFQFQMGWLDKPTEQKHTKSLRKKKPKPPKEEKWDLSAKPSYAGALA